MDNAGRLPANWAISTIGRHTGEPRTAVVGYIEDGEHLVVVASKGGLPEHPAWYLNLVANAQVTVERHGKTESMRARVAVAEERDRLWTMITTHYPTFTECQAGTSRQIPVVLLETAD